MFDPVAKEQPGLAGVHFGTALGNAEREARRRRLRVRGHGRFRPHKPRILTDVSIGDTDARGHAKPVVSDTGIGTEKAEWSVPFNVAKADEDQRLIFGWASIATVSGQEVVDRQGDVIPVSELENAAYDFVLNSRAHGHMHETKDTGRLIESCVFSVEKQRALGIDLQKEGWWVGFLVDSDEIWSAIKRGELPEFSIGGRAVPEEV